MALNTSEPKGPALNAGHVAAILKMWEDGKLSGCEPCGRLSMKSHENLDLRLSNDDDSKFYNITFQQVNGRLQRVLRASSKGGAVYLPESGPNAIALITDALRASLEDLFVTGQWVGRVSVHTVHIVCVDGVPTGHMWDKGQGRKGFGFPHAATVMHTDRADATKAAARLVDYLIDLDQKKQKGTGRN